MFFLYKKYQNPNPNNTKNQQETQNPDKKKKTHDRFNQNRCTYLCPHHHQQQSAIELIQQNFLLESTVRFRPSILFAIIKKKARKNSARSLIIMVLL